MPIVVLGSKPGAMLPDIAPEAVYTANGAARRARVYAQDGQTPAATAITGRRNIDNNAVRQALIHLAPQRVLIRRKNDRAERELRPLMNRTQFVQLSERTQWDFQKQFFPWRLLYGELQYVDGFRARWTRLKAHAKRGWCSLGASTGLYAALVAATEHPDMCIILAGIGIEPGGDFYLDPPHGHGPRANVDAWLFPRLPKRVRSRLFTTDAKLAEVGAANPWTGSVLSAEQ